MKQFKIGVLAALVVAFAACSGGTGYEGKYNVELTGMLKAGQILSGSDQAIVFEIGKGYVVNPGEEKNENVEISVRKEGETQFLVIKDLANNEEEVFQIMGDGTLVRDVGVGKMILTKL